MLLCIPSDPLLLIPDSVAICVTNKQLHSPFIGCYWETDCYWLQTPQTFQDHSYAVLGLPIVTLK